MRLFGWSLDLRCRPDNHHRERLIALRPPKSWVDRIIDRLGDPSSTSKLRPCSSVDNSSSACPRSTRSPHRLEREVAAARTTKESTSAIITSINVKAADNLLRSGYCETQTQKWNKGLGHHTLLTVHIYHRPLGIQTFAPNKAHGHRSINQSLSRRLADNSTIDVQILLTRIPGPVDLEKTLRLIVPGKRCDVRRKVLISLSRSHNDIANASPGFACYDAIRASNDRTRSRVLLTLPGPAIRPGASKSGRSVGLPFTSSRRLTLSLPAPISPSKSGCGRSTVMSLVRPACCRCRAYHPGRRRNRCTEGVSAAAAVAKTPANRVGYR